MMGISYVAPGAAIFASIGTMMLNGSAGTVTGLDSLTTNKRVKLGLESGNILAENGVNYVLQCEKMSRYNDQLRIFFDWTQEPDRYRFLSVNGFKLFDWEDYKLPTQSFSCTGRYSDTIGFPNEGIAEVRIATYALPKENKELYSKFPGLKAFVGFYDPEKLYTLSRLETEGIRAT